MRLDDRVDEQPFALQTSPADPTAPADGVVHQPRVWQALALMSVVAIVPGALIGFILVMIWTRTPLVPFWDEWETVVLVQHFTQGTLTWNDFWALHSGHRIVIPQMLDLALILATRWNRQVEMSFDLLLSVFEAALFVASVRRGLRSKALTTLAIAPISLAIFSLAQVENWLWPFQITFICTVLGVALCIWGLTASAANRWAFPLTLVGATLAALSSLGGLVTFVAFLPAIASRGYKKTLVWLALATAIIVPYMQGFPHGVGAKLTPMTLLFCLSYLGAPAGSPSFAGAFLAGLASVALAVANVAYYWVRQKRIAPLLPWIGLGAFAIGLSLVTYLGRAVPGYELAIAQTSRYQVFGALWWVAVIYVLMLNIKLSWAQRTITKALALAKPPVIVRLSPWMLAANVVLLVGSTAGLVGANWTHVSNMETYQYDRLPLQACIVNVDYATNACLWQFYPYPWLLAPRVAYLRSEHFAIFSGAYQKLVQPAPTPPMHGLLSYYNPRNGDHWTTTSYAVNYYGPYVIQQTLGYVYDQEQPGTHAIYTCVASNGHHFVSLTATCVGGTYLRTEGWLLNAPPATTRSSALVHCMNAVGDFVWPSQTCAGATNLGALGYTLTNLPGWSEAR